MQHATTAAADRGTAQAVRRGSSGRTRPQVVGGPGQMPVAARGNGGRRGRADRAGRPAARGRACSAVGGWYLGSGRWTTTPSVVGTDPGRPRTAKLQAQGLHVADGPGACTARRSRPGWSSRTDPAPLDRVAKGGTVTLILSRGPERYAVPDVTGKSVGRRHRARSQATTWRSARRRQAYSDTVADRRT